MYLAFYDEPFEIFFEDRKSEWDDIYYCAWMDILYQAVRSLKFYSADKKEWGQAHCQAAWAIFAAVREKNPGLITFEFSKLDDGRDYFTMKVDRKALREGGHAALSEFLAKLHELKSLGDYDTAHPWFTHYSTVDEEMLKIRDLVILHQLPRRLELQPNLLDVEGLVAYRDYPVTYEGIIESYTERFGPGLLQDVYDEWAKNAPAFRYE